MSNDQSPRSLLTRIRDGIRSFRLGPFLSSDHNPWWRFGQGHVYSGVSVSEETALGVSAFFCAVSTISQDVASLPLFLYKGSADGGKQRFDNHPLNRLLHDQPNSEMTSFQFRAAMMVNALATGNAFAEIVRDGGGRPTALWHILPHRVTPFRQNGQLLYRVSNPNGDGILDASDMLHFRGPSPDGILGYNIVQLGREALGLSIAAERFGATFFGNGSSFGGMLSTTGTLTEQARKNLRDALAARHQGSANAHKLMLLENGATYTPIGVNPRDSQFNELRVHQIREVARFFRIPVAYLGDLERATYSNFEQMQLTYYTTGIRPWLVSIEQELDSKLIAPSERNIQHFEHSAEGFLRADTEKRAQFYSTMISTGIMTINECRSRENLPPIPGGDVPRVPMNTEALAATPAPPNKASLALPSVGQSASMVSSVRDVLITSFQGGIRREIDRARKQVDAAKLRKHVDTFYSDLINRAQLADRMRPAVRMWLAFSDSDADVDKVCLSLAQSHFEQSRLQLLNVADEHDDDDLPRALEALLATWESGNRAANTIDHLIQHGVTTVTTTTIVKPPRPLTVETVAMHTKQWQVEHEVDMGKLGLKPLPPNTSPALVQKWRQLVQAMEQ
jgi:HK97 family phage portal protein